VYITLLTPTGAREDLVEGLGAGADDYLTKPCHPEELRARLRTGQRILQLEDILVGAREEMRVQATQDSLTRLLNRGAIFAALTSKLHNARLRMSELSLMLCDIDHFKKINDTYGHHVGDEVLREVAARLKGSVRKGAVGRYGGEEFMLLLEGCGGEFLGTVSNRICAMIRSVPIETSAGPLQVTMSAGAVVIEDELSQLSTEKIVQRADLLLYQAKRQGRDRAVVDCVPLPLSA
jgi:two-component system, cell cycle response regulator